MVRNKQLICFIFEFLNKNLRIVVCLKVKNCCKKWMINYYQSSIHGIIIALKDKKNWNLDFFADAAYVFIFRNFTCNFFLCNKAKKI